MTDTSQTIAFQGRPGAYSDLACRNAYPGWTTLPCDTFEAAMEAVRGGRAELAMMPTENSLAGRVPDIHRLLPEQFGLDDQIGRPLPETGLQEWRTKSRDHGEGQRHAQQEGGIDPRETGDRELRRCPPFGRVGDHETTDHKEELHAEIAVFQDALISRQRSLRVAERQAAKAEMEQRDGQRRKQPEAVERLETEMGLRAVRSGHRLVAVWYRFRADTAPGAKPAPAWHDDTRRGGSGKPGISRDQAEDSDPRYNYPLI